jgi:hypothetical protein
MREIELRHRNDEMRLREDEMRIKNNPFFAPRPPLSPSPPRAQRPRPEPVDVNPFRQTSRINPDMDLNRSDFESARRPPSPDLDLRGRFPRTGEGSRNPEPVYRRVSASGYPLVNEKRSMSPAYDAHLPYKKSRYDDYPQF